MARTTLIPKVRFIRDGGALHAFPTHVRLASPEPRDQPPPAQPALGHHSAAFTLSRYTHLLPGDEAPALDLSLRRSSMKRLVKPAQVGEHPIVDEYCNVFCFTEL